jgi:hypothetical protein
MRDHPSGRPVRRETARIASIQRIPRDEPLTPRLRRRELVEAIGFVTSFDPENREPEDE